MLLQDLINRTEFKFSKVKKKINELFIRFWS